MEDGSYKKPEFDAHRSDNEVRVEGGGEKVRERERRGMFACVCEREGEGDRETGERYTQIHTQGGRGGCVCVSDAKHTCVNTESEKAWCDLHSCAARLFGLIFPL